MHTEYMILSTVHDTKSIHTVNLFFSPLFHKYLQVIKQSHFFYIYYDSFETHAVLPTHNITKSSRSNFFFKQKKNPDSSLV